MSPYFRLLAFLILLLLPLSAAAPRYGSLSNDDEEAEMSVNRGKGPRWLNKMVTESAVLRQHQVGISITEVETGEKLYELNADRYFTPASNMKLFSFYAGLHLLGDSLPSLRYVVRHDSLLFWGTGDPTLLHGDVPSRRAFDFLQKRPEKLFYREMPMTEASFGPGWGWDDYNYYYQPERSAFPVYGNVIRFYAGPNKRPAVRPRFFNPVVKEAPAGFPHPADDHVRRELTDNHFVYFVSPKKWIDETPFRPSSQLVLQLLQDTLRRPVLNAPWHSVRPQEAVRTLAGLPVDSLYRRMLQVSDNLLAEQLLLMCSARLRSDSLSTQTVIRAVQAQFLQNLPDAPRWVDGSGLSRKNLVTPRTLSALLLKLHQEVPEPRLLSLLAAGGGHGTLRRVYRDASGPWFWGKTGTLSNNHNVCGYLRTRRGHLLAVSFMNNNHVVETIVVRQEMERVLKEVRERM
ncbi:peptidase S13 D-Ala-D-Ala carboxypeptidase C [Hymenobacter roseosalivarius DSM 11622]|uniref:Peptidase S13 D-Ala-D-Ala carboxypeptidase C n=1 Tax=Hymenobacter roseosalivarius DSM 11622 TaxID=645990 RepID=A0A1W1VWD0_9BACT|nr:D-alanyl-D-alanine carboxypeptidase [Hymenobacter roseosalivarius]SMB97675.1 peptidase S13 D-Ala-D-Ala carboxypeptidase C [Hymenobacter roseosalivarius DSM 11622]